MFTRPNNEIDFASLIRLARQENLQARLEPTEKIKFLLKNGLNINQRDESDFTPLALALCHQEIINLDLVWLLLRHGANPELVQEGTHLIANLVDNLFDEYFNIYMSEERIEELNVFYKQRNDSILDSIRMLIDFGINLDKTINGNLYHMPSKNSTPIPVIDYIKYVMDKNKNYSEEEYKIAKLNKMLDYYAEKDQKNILGMKG